MCSERCQAPFAAPRSLGDPAVLTKWRGVVAEAPVDGGHRNEVWSGRSPRGPVAVRRSVRSPASLAWELDLLDRLDAAGFVVPVVVRTDDGDAHDDGIVVQRWVEGTEPRTPDGWRLIADELLRLHDRFRGHPQRPGCRTVIELGRHDRSVDAEMSALPDDVATDVLSIFAAFRGVETSVVHGDPAPSNLRITPDGRVGLLDWDESRVDVVHHDLSNLGIRVLDDASHERAVQLSNAWEAANAWIVEPDYARRRRRALARGDQA